VAELTTKRWPLTSGARNVCDSDRSPKGGNTREWFRSRGRGHRPNSTAQVRRLG
jgi:hypothetical protein